MKNLFAATLMAAGIAFAGAASATEVMGIGTPNAEQFRAQVMSSDAFEITSSQIALTHAKSQKVKDFAAMMVKDHTATTDKLIAVAGGNKEKMQAQMKPGADGKYQSNDLFSAAVAAELNSLNAKSNEDFDKTYMDAQVDTHEDAVELFEDYAKNGDSARLKTFASETLPKLREHLDTAKKVEMSLGGNKNTM